MAALPRRRALGTPAPNEAADRLPINRSIRVLDSGWPQVISGFGLLLARGSGRSTGHPVTHVDELGGRHDVLHGLDDGPERRFGGDDLDEVAVLCADDMDAVAELLDAAVSLARADLARAEAFAWSERHTASTASTLPIGNHGAPLAW